MIAMQAKSKLVRWRRHVSRVMELCVGRPAWEGVRVAARNNLYSDTGVKDDNRQNTYLYNRLLGFSLSFMLVLAFVPYNI